MPRRHPTDHDSPPLERSSALRSRAEDAHAATPRAEIGGAHGGRAAGPALGSRAQATPAAAGARTKVPSTPMLRDRLREVLERDRALADASRSFAHGFGDEESGTRVRLPGASDSARPEGARAAAPRALDPDEIASIDALLSGDFAPTRAAGEHSPAAEPRWPDTESRAPDTEPPPPVARATQPSAAWLAARSWRGAKPRRVGPVTTTPAAAAAAAAAQPPAEPPVFSLFADWIAEEVSELAEPSPAPIVLTPELAPTLHTSTLAPGAPDEGEDARTGNEPIRTRTMARLLAGHGYKARALSIYEELLARRPDDADLRAEAEALRRSPK